MGMVTMVMFDEGMILVTTSNQPPDGLYKDGLHRDRILPFLANLKQKTNVVKIPEGEDWRQRSLHGKKYWISPINPQNKLKVNDVWINWTYPVFFSMKRPLSPILSF